MTSIGILCLPTLPELVTVFVVAETLVFHLPALHVERHPYPCFPSAYISQAGGFLSWLTADAAGLLPLPGLPGIWPGLGTEPRDVVWIISSLVKLWRSYKRQGFKLTGIPRRIRPTLCKSDLSLLCYCMNAVMCQNQAGTGPMLPALGQLQPVSNILQNVCG